MEGLKKHFVQGAIQISEKIYVCLSLENSEEMQTKVIIEMTIQPHIMIAKNIQIQIFQSTVLAAQLLHLPFMFDLNK